jgi:hypothetical protein
MSRFLPLLIAACILFLIDLYAYQAIRHVVSNASITARRAAFIVYWSVSFLTLASIFFFGAYGDFYELPQTLRVIWFGAMIIFYLPKILLLPFLLIDDLIRGGRWIVSLLSPPPPKAGGNGITRSEFLVNAGLLVSGLFFGGLIYGVFRGGYNYQVRKLALKIPHLPEKFNGLRIVQISDIHTAASLLARP